MKKVFHWKKYLWKPNFVGYLIRVWHRLRWILLDSRIPSHQRLWRSVYRREQLESNGRPKPSFFRDSNGLSTDLAVFSTRKKSRLGYTTPPKWPKTAGLVEIRVGNVRRVSNKKADVKHDPDSNTKNYSHTIFTGKITEGQSKKLAKKAVVVVKADLPGI